MHLRHTEPTVFRQWTALLALYAFFVQQYIAPIVRANPVGGSVVAGTATINSGRGTLTIEQSSPRAIITWTDFSIAGGETTQFIHGTGASGMTLNRVTGAVSSTIAGNLTANGQVFLINPNGLLVTGTGVINTATFLGSTRDITDSNFLNGTTFTLDGTSNAGVEIQPGAQITAATGNIILLGQTVSNSGTLRAPNGVVGLAAGKQIIYQPAAGEVIRVVSGQGVNAGVGVQNTGVLQAAQAELKAAGGNVYAVAVNARGTTTATSTTTRNGRIMLTSNGGNVAIGGTQTASGRRSAITTAGPNVTSGRVIVERDAALTGSSLTLAATNSVRSYGALNAGGGTVSVTGTTVDLRGRASAATVRVRSSSSLRVGRVAAAPAEARFTDPAGPSQVDAATLGSTGAGGRTIDLESTQGELTVSDRLALAPGNGPSLRLAAARNVNINAQTFTSGGTTVTAGDTVSINAPLQDFGRDVFVKSGTGRVNLARNGALQASPGRVVVAAGGGFTNTAKAGAAALQPTGGRWILFSPSPAQTNLGGLNPATTLYSVGQPATLADVPPTFGGNARTVAYASGDPAFQSANLTTGGDFFFNDQIVNNGAPSQPTLDPSVQNPTIDPTLYNLQQSPTYHAAVVPAGETAQQRADRLAKEAVILQVLGLPNDPSFFPFVFQMVRDYLGSGAADAEIAAFFASLATNEDNRFALGAFMSVKLAEGAKNKTLSADGWALLAAMNSQLQAAALAAATTIYNSYLDYKQRQVSGPLSLGNLAVFSGDGFTAPPIIAALSGSNKVELSTAARFGIGTAAGVGAGIGILGAFAGLGATGSAGAVGAAGALFGTGVFTGGAAFAAGVAAAPVVFLVIAVVAMTAGIIKADKINDVEIGMKNAIANASKGFDIEAYLATDEGTAALAQMLAYQFCIKPGSYAAGVQAAATGTTNLPVTTH